MSYELRENVYMSSPISGDAFVSNQEPILPWLYIDVMHCLLGFRSLVKKTP